MKNFAERSIEEIKLERHRLEIKVAELQERLTKITADLERAARDLTLKNAQKELVQVTQELGELAKQLPALQSDSLNNEQKPGLRSVLHSDNELSTEFATKTI